MDSNLPRLQLELYKEIKKVTSLCGLIKLSEMFLSCFMPCSLLSEYFRYLEQSLKMLLCLCRTVPLGVWGQRYGGSLSFLTLSDHRNAGMEING